MPYRFASIGAGVLCLTVAAYAQDPSASAVNNGSGETLDPHPRLLVSTQGKIIEGRISHSASGYVVDVNGGSFLIPFQMVKFTATSRHDAYLKYKALMPEETATNHFVLAKWCVENQLLNDASHELKQSLYLEPNRKDAARLLAYTESLQNKDGSAREATQATGNAMGATSFRKPAVSLNGLSPETVGEYGSEIQPILINNCAKAGCHHAEADNRLQLQYVRLTGYGNRIATSQNLSKVLEQLDTHDPENSPLLVRARSNHGQARHTLVMAPKGKEILDRLEQWVETATRELNPEAAPVQTGTESTERALTQSPQGRIIDRNSLPKDEREFVRQILNQQQYDPFDPARFNRTVRPSAN